MKRVFCNSTLLLILLLGFIFPNLAKAQFMLDDEDGAALLKSIEGTVAAQNINILTTPANPRPNQSVTVEVQSYSTDLNKATITWYLDGQKYFSGIGKKSIEVVAKEAGKTLTIKAVILTDANVTVERTLKLSPAEVDLVWEAVSYVPPFYEGKKMFSHMSKVKFAAVPYFPAGTGYISSKNLIYKWTKNGEVIESGYGKDSVTVEGKIILRPFSIMVEVSSLDGTQTAVAVIDDFMSTDPEVILYENNPALGTLYNRAIVTGTRLTGGEVIFSASPFFFSTENAYSSNMKYKWSLNNSSLADQLGKNITVRPPENESGFSNIGLTVENTLKLLQGAETQISISYGK